MRERMIDSYDYMKTVVDEKFCFVFRWVIERHS